MNNHTPKITTEQHLVTVEYTETVTRTATVRVPAGVDLADPDTLIHLTEQCANLATESDNGLDSEISFHGPTSQIRPGAFGSIDGDYDPEDL